MSNRKRAEKQARILTTDEIVSIKDVLSLATRIEKILRSYPPDSGSLRLELRDGGDLVAQLDRLTADVLGETLPDRAEWRWPAGCDNRSRRCWLADSHSFVSSFWYGDLGPVGYLVAIANAWRIVRRAKQVGRRLLAVQRVAGDSPCGHVNNALAGAAPVAMESYHAAG